MSAVAIHEVSPRISASLCPADGRSRRRIDAAYATLVRGSDFLAWCLRASVRCSERTALGGAGGAKVVGNGLRELDRFLSLLVDETAIMLAPGGFDDRGFARQRNVANKLGLVHTLAGVSTPERDRLRAIGRVRDCLHHCRGVVHDATLADDLCVAAGGDAMVEPQNAEADRLTVSFDQLAGICRFYAETGARLMAVCEQNRPLH